MDFKELQLKKTDQNAIIPTRGTPDSAGLDLYACLGDELTLAPRDQSVVSTGIAVALPAQTVGLVFGRSGLGINHGITLSNSVGVIDADYRGEIKVGLINQSDEAYTIKPGDRIAQLVIMPIVLPELKLVEELAPTPRADAGFGSTGR